MVRKEMQDQNSIFEKVSDMIYYGETSGKDGIIYWGGGNICMLFIHHKGRRNTLTKDRTDRVHTT